MAKFNHTTTATTNTNNTGKEGKAMAKYNAFKSNTTTATATATAPVLTADEITAIQRTTADAIQNDVPQWVDFRVKADYFEYLAERLNNTTDATTNRIINIAQRIAHKAMVFKWSQTGTETYIPWINTELHSDLTSAICVAVAEVNNCVYIDADADTITVYHLANGNDVTHDYLRMMYRIAHREIRRTNADYLTSAPTDADGRPLEPVAECYDDTQDAREIRLQLSNLVGTVDGQVLEYIMYSEMTVTEICAAMKWSSRTSYYKAVNRIAKAIGKYHDLLVEIVADRESGYTSNIATNTLRTVRPYNCTTPNVNRKTYIAGQMKRAEKLLRKRDYTETEIAEKLAKWESTYTTAEIETADVVTYSINEYTPKAIECKGSIFKAGHAIKTQSVHDTNTANYSVYIDPITGREVMTF